MNLGNISEIFDSQSFMPHGHCYLWRPEVLWVHVISDFLIGLSYYSIPAALIYLVYKRKDLAFNWMFVMFAAFILACGTNHFLDIYTTWNPIYFTEGAAKGFTAIVSVATAAAIWPLVPKAIALPSAEQLRSLNADLAKEIEERKKTEANLRTSELQKRSVLETAYDAFIAVDGDGIIIDWNRQAEKIFGWSRDDALGQQLTKLLKPHNKSHHFAQIKNFLEEYKVTDGAKRFETTVVNRQGFDVPVEVSVSPIKNSPKVILSAFVRDISEKKLDEQLEAVHFNVTRILSEAESIQDAFTKSLEAICSGLKWDVGIFWMVDESSERLVFANIWNRNAPELEHFARHCKTFAFGPGVGVPGMIWQMRKPLWIFDMAAENRYPRSDQAKVANLHGAYAFPLFSGGEVIGVLEFMLQGEEKPVDKIFEMMAILETRMGLFVQKVRAEEMRQARDAAEAANRAKSTFLANMSHEIRTPLGAVLGFSELLLNPDVTSSEKLNYVAAIKRNGDLLSNIINDILDLSKVEAGRMEIDLRETALPEILTDITTFLRLQATDKGIELRVSSDADLPDIIVTDPLRLRQILLNIVGNAIKFTDRGYVHLQVRFEELKDRRERLIIEVEDTGPGIAKEKVTKLFEPFSQVDPSTKRKFGGTGLGLALSKKLAHMLGGDVQLTRSQPGSGSLFTIYIDPGQTRRLCATPAKKLAVSPDATNTQRLDGINVLLVEDAPDNQMLVSRILNIAGAAVELSSNGQEAVSRTDLAHFDVILMDLQMPLMDGYEATSRLRESGIKTPIIALTAHALKEEQQRCLSSGFSDHLSKPVNRQLLIERLAFHAKTSSSQTQQQSS